MQFWKYLKFQLRQLMLQKRWLLIFPVMGFIAYLLSNVLTLENYPQVAEVSLGFGVSADDALPFNAWDALFIAFGNAEYMTFAIANLFLLLVSNSLPENEFGQLAVYRLASRRQWWLAKSLSMLIAAFTFVITGMLVVLGYGALKLGFEPGWSRFADYGANILVPFIHKIRITSPLGLGLVVFALCTLGFWALSMLMQVVSLALRKNTWGYLSALLVMIGGLAVSEILINVPDWMKILTPIRNMILTHWPFPFRNAPIWWSFLYWVIFLSLLLWLGWKISQRFDLFSAKGSKEEGV